MELKSLSPEDLAQKYGAGDSGSLNHLACEGEFKRRELFWIRLTAIVAVISFVVIGLCNISGVYIDYLSYKNIMHSRVTSAGSVSNYETSANNANQH